MDSTLNFDFYPKILLAKKYLIFKRARVDDEFVNWNVNYRYEPLDFTAPVVLAKPVWADPENPKY